MRLCGMYGILMHYHTVSFKKEKNELKTLTPQTNTSIDRVMVSYNAQALLIYFDFPGTFSISATIVRTSAQPHRVPLPFGH